VLEGEAILANVAVTVAPLMLAIEGIHRVAVDLDGERAADLPLPVGIRPIISP